MNSKLAEQNWIPEMTLAFGTVMSGVLVLLLLVTAQALAKETVVSATIPEECSDQRLSVHDVGEYASTPWRRGKALNTSIKPDSRADRVRDLNLSIASVNLPGPDKNRDSWYDNWANAAKSGKQQGKIFLPRIHFWHGDRVSGPLSDFEIYWQRMDKFLDAMVQRDALKDFYGICLAEENVWWAGRPEILTKMFYRIKEKYPYVKIFQWWTPMRKTPSFIVPTDGWIHDPYSIGGRRIRRHVQRYLVTGKPFIFMPWAAWWDPEKKPWEPEKWQILEDQLQVCKEYNLPTAFFWVGPNKSCNFGMMRGTFMEKVNQRVLDWIKEVRSLPVDYDGLSSADLSEGDGIILEPTETGGEFKFCDSFDTSEFILNADISGFRDLLWEESRTLAVRSFNGRSPQASLTYRFTFDKFAAKYPTVRLNVLYLAKGSEVRLSISPDGNNWTVVSTTDTFTPKLLSINTQRDKLYKSTRKIFLHMEMLGSLTNGNIVSRIDEITVDGKLLFIGPPEATE